MLKGSDFHEKLLLVYLFVVTFIAAPFFVLGYGAGTYGAIFVKSRWRSK